MPKANKNKYQHNDDGTTHIFVESKNKYFPGKHTIIIDTEDWDRVKEYKWHISGNVLENYPYAATMIPHPAGGVTARGTPRRTVLPLHHAVIGKPTAGKVVDHRNHIGLDNRKDNLRFVTKSQNQHNRRPQKNSSSDYKGVCWDKREKKWRAMRGPRHLGYFTCEHEAALAYNKKAIELWGEEHVLLNEVGKV